MAARTTDYDTMSPEELREIIKLAQKALDSYESRKRADILAQLNEVAKSGGYSLAELVSGAPAKTRKQRAPSTVQYRNPDDETQTWSGRGRRPAWMGDADKDQFLIK